MWPSILKPNQDHEDKKTKKKQKTREMCCCFIWHISQTVNLFTETKHNNIYSLIYALVLKWFL